MMLTAPRSALRRYSIVPLVVALALACRWLLLGGEMPFLLLWPAVMICAWLGGLVPGLLATALAAVLTACLFYEPPHWFALTKPADWAGMALFVLLGSAISLLCAKLRRSHGQLEQYAGDLRRRAEELAQADQRKNEFVSLLAHELRNPLAPIHNAVGVLKVLGAGQPDLERVAAVIERQSQQARRLIDDLLDISRISLGRVNLHKEPIELADVIDRAVEESRPLIEARRHELTVRLPEQPLRLDADAARLAQVVANLLNNAAKYTDEGGHVWLTVEQSGAEAVLRVRDDGIGIMPAMLPRVFDLYAQGERALGKSQGGLGIGLKLVRSLVEMHGGTVQALSGGPGRGSEFVVRLPVIDMAQQWQGAVGDGKPARPQRLSVPDDKPSAQKTA
jgi:signal transduction histidine kinase